MNSTFKYPEQRTIDAWKRKHGAIHKMTLTAPGHQDAVCIVREPKLNDLKQASMLTDGDPFKSGWIQFQECLLAGDDRIQTEDALKLAACKRMEKIFQVYKASVESVVFTDELKAELKAKITSERFEQIKGASELRLIKVVVGTEEVLDKKGKDTREVVSAYCSLPTLAVREVARTANTAIDMGQAYLNECWIHGDDRMIKGDHDSIRFAACIAGLGLFKAYAVRLEKL